MYLRRYSPSIESSGNESWIEFSRDDEYGTLIDWEDIVEFTRENTNRDYIENIWRLNRLYVGYVIEDVLPFIVSGYNPEAGDWVLYKDWQAFTNDIETGTWETSKDQIIDINQLPRYDISGSRQFGVNWGLEQDLKGDFVKWSDLVKLTREAETSRLKEQTKENNNVSV